MKSSTNTAPDEGAVIRLQDVYRTYEMGDQVLNALDGTPLLDLGMRLGEGSGAAVAVPLLRAACALHNHMASFADAGVSGKSRE